MFCTVAVLFVHHRHHQPRPVPRLLRRVVLDVIARMLRMTGGESKMSQSRFDSPAESDAPATDVNTSSGDRERAENNEQQANDQSMSISDAARSFDTDHQQSISDEWIEMARIIDRFFFVIFGAIIVVMTSCLVILMAVKGPRKVEPMSVIPATS